jgi:tellurite resistance protein TerC
MTLILLGSITPWHWASFLAAVLVFLALDLGVFHRKGRVVSFKEALAWTTLWFTLAMCFSVWMALSETFSEEPTRWKEFLTGYLVELSLSMDNVFVIALIFQYFRIPGHYQHRVLFWGILGALLMRGLMIIAGVQLVQEFQWILILFGAFLVYSGYKMLTSDDSGPDPEKNPILIWTHRFFPVTADLRGERFFVREDGRFMLTPLFLVLIMVETTDLIFALDSIPAIIGISTNMFVVFTSNVFAILGLRSLYFVLANALDYFTYLKYGLAAVLVFIGIKMLVRDYVHIEATAALFVIAGILLSSIVVSLLNAGRGKKAATKDNQDQIS